MQTYTDGTPQGHLRSREASLIAAMHRAGNIGFQTKRRSENNPMQSSGVAEAKSVRSEGTTSGIWRKYLIQLDIKTFHNIPYANS
jgi:hypothetical protein